MLVARKKVSADFTSWFFVGLLTCLATWHSQAVQANEAWRQFVIANAEMTLSHEFGHLVLDELQMPMLGNMEQAADSVAILLYSPLMAQVKQDDWRAFSAVADEYRLEWLTKDGESQQSYWASHPLEPQRFFNMACLIYGSDPEAMEHFLAKADLPFSRAVYCHDEYKRAAAAIEWITRQPAAAGGDISVHYEQPYSENGKLVLQWLQESGVVPRLVQQTQALNILSRDLRLSFANCAQAEGMWLMHKGEIVICYQLLERYLYLAQVRDGALDQVLSFTDWTAFCMYETIATHAKQFDCRPRVATRLSAQQAPVEQASLRQPPAADALGVRTRAVFDNEKRRQAELADY